MSYDLTLFRVAEGADPLLTNQRVVEQNEVDVAAKARIEMCRIADLVKSWRPTLEEFQPKSPLLWIDLTDDDLPIQFGICDGQINVTMPYFGDQPEELLDCAIGCLDTLNAIGDYHAYDPQLGRLVARADLNQMIGQYGRVDGAFPEVRAQAGGKKPWWKIR